MRATLPPVAGSGGSSGGGSTGGSGSNATATNNASIAQSVLNSLTSSQTEISVITPDIRVVSQKLNASTTPGTPTTISLPLTDEEKLLQEAGLLNVPTVNIFSGSSSGSNASPNNTLYIAVALIDASLWTRPNTTETTKPSAGQLQSNIVSISASGGNVSFVDISFSPVQSGKNATPPVNFTIICPPTALVRKSFVCNDTGYVELIQCKGIAEVYRGVCPVLKQTCAALDLNSLTVSTQNLCKTLNSTNANGTSTGITCRCGLGADSAAGSSSVAAGVVLTLGGSDVSKTFQSSSAFSDGSAATKAAIVLSLFCGLWGASILVILYFAVNWEREKFRKVGDEKDAFASSKVAEDTDYDSSPKKVLKRLRSAWMNTRVASSTSLDENMPAEGKAKSMEALLERKKELLSEYISSLFPDVFMCRSMLEGILQELYRKHIYINFFFKLNQSKTPILKVLEMVTLHSCTLFLLAFLYDLNYPSDDGSCPFHTTEIDCLKRRYLFDTSKSYCAWTPFQFDSLDGVGDSSGVSIMDDEQSLGYMECAYVNPSFSFITLMYVSIMISLATCIFMDPLALAISLLGSPIAESQSPSPPADAMPPAADVAIDEESQVIRPVESTAVVKKSRRASVSFRHVPHSASALALDYPHDIELHDVRGDSKSSIASSTPFKMSAASLASTQSPSIYAWSNSSNGIMEQLEQAVKQHRYSLLQLGDMNAVKEFDTAWCIDRSTGSFVTLNLAEELSWRKCWKIQDLLTVRDVIEQEVKSVHKQASELLEELDEQTAAERGFEILVQFIQDLLGRHTAASKIFAMKIELEYEKTHKVSLMTKCGIILLLVGMNGFFLYYTLLKGIAQGTSWQRSFVTAWILQVLLDILFFETIQTLWFHYFIPILAKTEVS